MSKSKNPESSDLVRVCMDCKHQLDDQNEPVMAVTVDLSQGDPGFVVSHGICNVCLVARRDELARYKAARGRS